MASAPKAPPPPTDVVSFTPAQTAAPVTPQAQPPINQSSTGAGAGTPSAVASLGNAKASGPGFSAPYGGTWLGTA